MNIQLDDKTPIYLQIMNLFRHGMASGKLKSGDKIPPVRELAEDYGVNPNTMQKALSELEKEGLLYPDRTRGRFVTQDYKLLNDLRLKEASLAAKEYDQVMKSLGFTKEEALDFLRIANERNQGKQDA